MRITLRLVTAAALLLPLVLVSAEDKAYKPSLPLLHVKLFDGKSRLVKPGSDDALDDKARKALLEQHAAHVDEGNGWKGRDADGISENPLVLHVDAMADQGEVGNVVAKAAEQQIYRVVVGIPEHTDMPLKGGKAPDPEKLEAGYIHFDLPKDEGLQSKPPAVPKEEVTLYLSWDADVQGGNFIVAIDARGRKPVEKSWITADELKSKDAKRRNEVRDAAKKTVQEYITRSGAKIETISLKTTGLRREDPMPWVMVDLAYRAALAVNEERAKYKQKALEILLPFQYQITEPPPPEQPPEKPVEFPKDEPEQEDPTEEERIVPDEEDEGSRNSSGDSKGDLAENAEDDVRDPQAESEAQEREAHFKHRKRAEGALRANEERVIAALNWLKDHQNPEGYWSAKYSADDTTRQAATSTGNIEFAKDCPEDTGWEGICDIGLTGLALLAYSGAGYTHKDGEYRRTIRQAVLYLRKWQDNDGCFGIKEEDLFVYNHAISTMAMADVYGQSGDPVLKPIVDKAVEFILKAQNPGLGWRYGVQPGTNDSSITSWMVMALYTARLAGFKLDTDKAYTGAASWYEYVTAKVNGVPRTGYDVPGSNNARLRVRRNWESNPTLDAIYVKCMLAMGKADKQDATVKALAAKCVKAESLPKWELHKIDFYYWYYATRALRALEDDNWKTWESAVTKVLTENQRGFSKLDQDAKRTSAEDLDEHGSWDPVGAWGIAGGRVYSTAMGALTLHAAWHID